MVWQRSGVHPGFARAHSRSLTPVGCDQDVVKARPAIGDPVDLVPARDAHQVLLPRDARVDVGQEHFLGIAIPPWRAHARSGRRSSSLR